MIEDITLTDSYEEDREWGLIEPPLYEDAPAPAARRVSRERLGLAVMGGTPDQ